VTSDGATTGLGPRGVSLRAVARPQGAGPPLGLVFGGIGLSAGALVALLHLDRLPLVVCTFKAMTGLPCPTCGSTRALGRLFALDLAGALSMNPLATLGLLALGVWALADLLLAARRRRLALEVAPRLAFGLRVTVVTLVLANWVFLLAAGR
jgi:hypothetical protein